MTRSGKTPPSMPMFETAEVTISNPLTSFLADSRARTSASAGNARAWEKGRALVSGLNSAASSKNYDRVLSSSKTRQDYSHRFAVRSWRSVQVDPRSFIVPMFGEPSLFRLSLKSLASLPQWGTWDRGGLYRQPTPERRTSESVSSYWVTPSATDDKDRAPSANPHLTKNGTLRHLNAKGEQSFMRLSQTVLYWSTPAAQDAKNGTLPASPATRDTLPGDLIRWATPSVSDEKGLNRKRRDDPARQFSLADQAEIEAKTMNPDWVDTLMGLPPGWTALPLSRTLPANRHGMSRPAFGQSKTKRRNSASKGRRDCGRMATGLSGKLPTRWRGTSRSF